MTEPPDSELPISDAPLRRGLATGMPGTPLGDRLAAAVHLLPDRGDEMRAQAAAARADALAAGDASGAAWAQIVLGFADGLRSDHHGALAAFSEALATLDSLGDMAGRAAALNGLATAYTSLGQYEDAVECAEQAHALSRALGHTENEAWTRQGLANMLLELGEWDAARRLAQEALEQFQALGHRAGQARALVVVGGALRGLGADREACAALGEALDAARAEGATLTVARVLDDLGMMDAAAGRTAQAEARLNEALQIREAAGNRQAQATSRLHLGELLAARGEMDAARAMFGAALALAQETGSAPREAEAHRALSRVYESAGDAARALDHLRQHQVVRERLLSAQARSRVETLHLRAEAERAQRDAELDRVRTVELSAANRELEATLAQLRRAQDQLVQTEKMASLGRLSAGLAHEIRNPLHFVLNFAEVAASLAADIRSRLGAPDVPAALAADAQPDLDALVDSTDRVRHHAQRAEGIVRSLVGHARDTAPSPRGPVALPALVDAVLHDLVPPDAGVYVERHYDAALAPVVADAAALRQTVAALVANALRALREHPPAGAPALALVARPAEGEPPLVELVVADNGPGIAPEICARVFEPFFTTRPAGEGTGLGLALAYDTIVAGHGGTLTVQSQPGHGAAFTIRLPASPSGQAPAAAPAAASNGSDPGGGEPASAFLT